MPPPTASFSLPPPSPTTTVEVMVKDAALTRLLCNIPACLCAVSLAQEAEAEAEAGERDAFGQEGLPSHNYAQSVRSLISSLVGNLPLPSIHSHATGAGEGEGEGGVEAEVVVEVLPGYDDSGEVQTQRRPWVLAREILIRK